MSKAYWSLHFLFGGCLWVLACFSAELFRGSSPRPCVGSLQGLLALSVASVCRGHSFPMSHLCSRSLRALLFSPSICPEGLCSALHSGQGLPSPAAVLLSSTSAGRLSSPCTRLPGTPVGPGPGCWSPVPYLELHCKLMSASPGSPDSSWLFVSPYEFWNQFIRFHPKTFWEFDWDCLDSPQSRGPQIFSLKGQTSNVPAM